MIYVPVGGRLGNQMFYYAFARYIQENLTKKHEICFDFSSLIHHGENYTFDKKGWEDSLKYFNVNPYKTYNKNRVTYHEGNLHQKILSGSIALLRKKFPDFNISKHQFSLSKLGLFYNESSPEGDKTNIFNYDFNTAADKIFIRGVGENGNYCNVIRKNLLKEFEPKFEKLEHNKELYKIIENENSVCISIRRGDYVKNPEVAKRFNLCDERYFQTAIELVKKKISKPVLIVFSDDVEGCKRNINFNCPVYFERGSDPIWEKLRLMYSCKHFIISNSTFSWWAQWLSCNKNKVVISPDRWFNDANSSLIEDSFIKVSV